MQKRLPSYIALVAILFYSTTSLANPKIADHAIYPITQKGYPRLYSQWGPEGVRKINQLMPLAAEKAASSNSCDKVDIVEISQSRSSPKGNIVFFADCMNGKRFYITDRDLETSTPALSQTQKMAAISNLDATSACEKAIKRKLTYPLSFKKKHLSNSVYRAPSTGNIVVTFNFEAKNALGGVLPSPAKCVFTDQGLVEATILEN